MEMDIGCVCVCVCVCVWVCVCVCESRQRGAERGRKIQFCHGSFWSKTRPRAVYINMYQHELFPPSH